MKIAVVGSTGRTGLAFVQQALHAGHDVTALARTPSALSLTHERLRVAQADVLTSTDLAAIFEGHDAVVVSLGGAERDDNSTRSEGTKRVLAAMKTANVDRILVVSTAGVGSSFDQLPPGGQHVVKTVIRVAVEDHGRQEEAVIASGLRYTIARPGGLRSDALCAYHADPDNVVMIGSVPRACVADFLVRALEDASSENRIYALSADETLPT